MGTRDKSTLHRNEGGKNAQKEEYVAILFFLTNKDFNDDYSIKIREIVVFIIKIYILNHEPVHMRNGKKAKLNLS